MKILFLCRGNVGRSQFAEALYKIKHPEDEVTSAGIHVFDKEGNSKDGQLLKDIPTIENVLLPIKEIGLDFSNMKRKQLTVEMFNQADKVVLILEEKDNVDDYILNSLKTVRWDVPDPKGTSLERHKEIRDQIRKLIDFNFN